jgi:hypothetical protein
MSILLRSIYNEKYDSFTTPAGIITFAAVARKWKNKDSKKEGDEGAYILTLITPPKAETVPDEDRRRQAGQGEDRQDEGDQHPVFGRV